MNRNTLLSALATATLALALTGCELYFGPDYGDDDETYCCDEWGCYWTSGESCPDIGPGWECTANDDCAAGCFCSDAGYCEEAGFCESAVDCPPGFTCDWRDSCVPDTQTGCTSDSDCPDMSFCDEDSGYCIPSWECTTDAECGTGYTCDSRGTCIPTPCSSDADCEAGCYCDSGECVETGLCGDNAACPAGMTCDLERYTCEPDNGQDGGSCAGTITCATAEPSCATGQTPIIVDGCYSGACIAIDQCDVPPPPPSCEDVTTENACIARTDCMPVYTGVNCTGTNGQSCTANSAGCTCESFSYYGCGEFGG